MIVNIFHGVVVGVVLQPILSPGEQGLGVFFCNSKQIQICRFFFFPCDGGGVKCYPGCVCMRDGEKVKRVHT